MRTPPQLVYLFLTLSLFRPFCFVALKVYKELERLLKASGCPYSVDNVLRIAEVIVTLEINLQENRQTLTRTLYTSKEERDIAYLIETDDWLTSNG